MKQLHSLLLSAAISIAATGSALAGSEQPLTLEVYNADGNSFHVNSVLVTGESDAMLIDAQFTRADAHRLVAEILASGKTLKSVYVSHGDPDYYFGLEVIKAEFPDVKVYASQPTIDWINQTVEKKVAFWGPKMGANAPRQPIIPNLLPAEGLNLEGSKIEVKGLNGQTPGRSYVWIPSIKAVVGGVNVFSGLHLWTADTQSKASREAWVKILEGIEKLQPETVIPGHSAANADTGLAAVSYSKKYLQRYESELHKAADSGALINRMQQLYPDAGLGIALQIGAKVNTGEMKW
ncbi:MBL fold metallo-hydrolase [Marinobacterium jannaschii]|uniref:MBL fold metallo-hydrolase n=1 Tax=Marinobacterium jannaschii TaxID=64970 RepID=UPI000483B912|nr:MBL fold metallo-hydrolase [Marinobacterium jannaschii]